MIYLHIGHQKTGTTTIQDYFNNNLEVIENNNFYFPQTSNDGNGNHLKLAVFGAELSNKLGNIRKYYNIETQLELKKFRKSFMRDFLVELSNIKKDIFITSEHLFSLRENEILRIRKLLTQLNQEIKIILYIRHPGDFIYSSYSTLIKTGVVNDIYIPKPLNTASDDWVLGNIYTWIKVFGEESIIIRPFEKKDFIGNNLLSDIYNVLGLKFEEKEASTKKKNTALNIVSLEVLKKINVLLQGIDFVDAQKIRNGLIDSFRNFECPDTMYNYYTNEKETRISDYVISCYKYYFELFEKYNLESTYFIKNFLRKEVLYKSCEINEEVIYYFLAHYIYQEKKQDLKTFFNNAIMMYDKC